VGRVGRTPHHEPPIKEWIMTSLLSLFGWIALIVGVVLWVAMLRSGLSRGREEERRDAEEQPPQTTQP